MSIKSDQSSNQINNLSLNQNGEKQLSLEDLDESKKNNSSFEHNSNRDDMKLSKDDQPFQSQLQSQSQSPSQLLSQTNYQDNNINNVNSQIERLNSNAVTSYVNSLNKMIHNLNIENAELKLNFVQVSEMLQSEREGNKAFLSKQHSQSLSEIKLLQTNNEILQKEKQRHLEQNSIEKEQYEVQITNYKLENEQLASRIKKLKEENESLRKDNFDVHMRLMEANKLKYENECLREEIQKITSNLNGITSNDNSSNKHSKNKRNNDKQEGKRRTPSKDIIKKNQIKQQNNNTSSHISTINTLKDKLIKNSKSNKINLNKSNENESNNQKEKDTKYFHLSSIESNSQNESNADTNKKNSENQKNKYQMAPYEKISHKGNTVRQISPKHQNQAQSVQMMREQTEESNSNINNYNENMKMLKKVYNDYVLRLNAKAYQSLEEEEDLKKKMRMIMETIESQTIEKPFQDDNNTK